MEILMALLCAALLLWFNRLIFTRLISPAQQGTVPVFAVIPAVGDGDGLEQTLRHLHWLQGEKLSQFTLLIVDAGLTPPDRTWSRHSSAKTPPCSSARQRRPPSS